MNLPKKYIRRVGIVILGASLLLPVTSFAVEATVTATATATTTKPKDSIREKLDEVKARAKLQAEAARTGAATRTQELKQEMNEKRTEAKENIREKLQDSIKNRFSNLLEKLMDRFLAAIGRLEKLSQRISSRIAKLEAEGINVTEAKRLLGIAELKIDVAASSTAAIKVEADQFSASNASSTVLRREYAEVRSAVEKAKADIKAAHASLVDVISNLKPGINKVKINATTTASTTATTTATTTP